jgi:hypothetical protein
MVAQARARTRMQRNKLEYSSHIVVIGIRKEMSIQMPPVSTIKPIPMPKIDHSDQGRHLTLRTPVVRAVVCAVTI